jgi:hypothetical protein
MATKFERDLTLIQDATRWRNVHLGPWTSGAWGGTVSHKIALVLIWAMTIARSMPGSWWKENPSPLKKDALDEAPYHPLPAHPWSSLYNGQWREPFQSPSRTSGWKILPKPWHIVQHECSPPMCGSGQKWDGGPRSSLTQHFSPVMRA